MNLVVGPDDVTPEDPVFVLRRAVTYRTSSSRHRLSAPLDEIRLQKLHRESISSTDSASEGDDPSTKQRRTSNKELIMAQRAEWCANHRAILSAEANPHRGVDLLLPNNAVLRSSRYDTDERTRYSYVEGGETYDISDIMDEEWDSSTSTVQGDLLEGVLVRGRTKDGVDEKLHRVLSKIRDGRKIQRTVPSTPSSATTVDSVYLDAGQGSEKPTPVGQSISATPIGASSSKADETLPRKTSPASERTVTPDIRKQRSVTPSSTSQGRSTPQLQQQPQALLAPHLQQTSIASVLTATSGYRTAVGPPISTSPSVAKVGPLRQQKPKVMLPKDDFGVSHMMAIIELAGLQDKPPPLDPIHPFDEMLFGRPIRMDELHPAIREIYEPTFKLLNDMDQASTAKLLEGSSVVRRPEEKPLEAALDLAKVKRSSVGNISSIASNLSQHPPVRKLPMNDFTDDTGVAMHLKRRSESASDEGETIEGDTTTNGYVPGDGETGEVRLSPRPHNLSTVGVSVPSERSSSPSFRFALQLLIYPDDLPDDMVFDPLTEAIVFKNTLRDRTQAAVSSAPFRRKIFVFPKNIIVAEVIEIGLERFGIPDGVVDGGDEVEDKNTKRRSSSRVHYVLDVLIDGKGG